jgi:hypothetical protein
MRKRAVIVLLLVVTILFTIQTNAANETVQTNVEAIYNNAPPILIQNIPNQFVVINTNKLNAFDLDDYFIDNETLTYNASAVQNITITISNGLVSFYPDFNFTGVRYVVFTAYDGYNSTDSNNVTITIGADTQPPQWSNPSIFHPGNLIFQNTFVNFSVTWTSP